MCDLQVSSTSSESLPDAVIIGAYLGDVVVPDTSKPVPDLIIAYLSNFKKVGALSFNLVLSLHLRSRSALVTSHSNFNPREISVPCRPRPIPSVGVILGGPRVRAPGAADGATGGVGDPEGAEQPPRNAQGMPHTDVSLGTPAHSPVGFTLGTTLSQINFVNRALKAMIAEVAPGVIVLAQVK